MVGIEDFVNTGIIADLLGLGSLGFVGGVALPFAFRLVGFVVDAVRVVVRG